MAHRNGPDVSGRSSSGRRWRVRVVAEGGFSEEAAEIAGADGEDELLGGKLALARSTGPPRTSPEEEEKTLEWW